MLLAPDTCQATAAREKWKLRAQGAHLAAQRSGAAPAQVCPAAPAVLLFKGERELRAQAPPSPSPTSQYATPGPARPPTFFMINLSGVLFPCLLIPSSLTLYSPFSLEIIVQPGGVGSLTCFSYSSASSLCRKKTFIKTPLKSWNS